MKLEDLFIIKKQAKKEIFEYIEFYYNRTGSHSYLGNLSPNNFEEKDFMLQNSLYIIKKE
jgi:hypothetical protein